VPVLTGVSVFCLANRNSLFFTHLFGGSNGNEGLGLLSLSFDWQYIAGSANPMWFPLQTLFNNFIGYILCIVCFMGVYYGNVWRSKDFPFLSQLLFTANSNGTFYDQFNQTTILNQQGEVDQQLLAAQGLPFFTGTFVTYVLSTNLAITATFVHLLLWNYDDIKSAWSFASPSKLKSSLNPRTWNLRPWQSTPAVAHKETDPHYQLMLRYNDAPNWWYGFVLTLSILLGLISISLAESTLPWWGFLIACSLASICILFFGAQFAITGFAFVIQPVIQMIGGYLHPGKPIANMFFVLFGYNSVTQGQLMLKDLKFAQYAKLPPRCTFVMQMSGTVIGAVFSYIMMDSITTNQRAILLSIEGTNVWSGQTVQSFNSQAVAWGGLAKDLFSIGGRYEWVTIAFLLGFVIPVPFYLIHKYVAPKLRLDYLNTAIITYFIGWLSVGINSSSLAFLSIGFFSQLYLRKYRPDWFIKYNYILSAALDGGTQVIVFMLTFAVQGGSGKQVVVSA
jgi:OPT family oligopeptide transporter